MGGGSKGVSEGERRKQGLWERTGHISKQKVKRGPALHPPSADRHTQWDTELVSRESQMDQGLHREDKVQE